MSFFGIDIGGTNIAAGICDENGSIVAKASVPTYKGRKFGEIISDVAALCFELLKLSSISIQEISGIGIGTPGVVDKQGQSLIYASTFDFNNVSFKSELDKYFQVPIFIDNDANCAALAENLLGAAKDTNISIAITLGTGIGGGIIIDKKIYYGCNNASGEIGHMVIVSEGIGCECGRRGCWEKYASAKALIRMTEQYAIDYPKSLVSQYVVRNGGVASGRTAFEAAKAGDTGGGELVERYCTYLADGLTNLINIFQPQVITLGGGVGNQGDYLLNIVNKMVTERVYTKNINIPQTRILAAQLGNDAGIIGAALLCRSRIKRD
jgi:glucokinase